MPSEASQPPTFVFVHGMIGFESIGFGRHRVAFFRGVPEVYRQLGYRSVFPRVSNLASVEQRAKDLSVFIEAQNLTRVILVGASMGGLDSRYYAAHLDSQKRVCALVTVGTPHRGSPVADKIVTGRWPGRVIAPHTANDLATSSSADFNARTPDRPDVQYFSYAGVRPQSELPLWMRLTGRCVRQVEGANDGLVSQSSASWGRQMGTYRADHFELVGWNLGMSDPRTERPFNHLKLYRELATNVLEALEP